MNDEMGTPGGTAPKCSFCEEEQSSSVRLIKGPNVYICEGCVECCRDILNGPNPKQASPNLQVEKLPSPNQIYDS